MKLLKLLSIFLTLIILSVACRKDLVISSDQLTVTDQTFLLEANLANMAEIDAANLAISKATTPEVIAYAYQMLADHKPALAELRAVADSVGFPVRDSVDPVRREVLFQLGSFSNRAFDSAYIHQQAFDHRNTRTIIGTEIVNGNHVKVKGYAYRILPHIEEHMLRADSIRSRLF